MDIVIFSPSMEAQRNWFWSRQPMGGREANQPSDLINRLVNFHFSGCPDSCTWRDDSRGGFAVKYVRLLLDTDGITICALSIGLNGFLLKSIVLCEDY